MSALQQTLPLGVPLILKASCDERIKRIRFAPELSSLDFSEFQQKIARSLQFEGVDFCVTWKDDDGEHCDIANTDDLHEALLYFCPSESDSSLAALTMRVNVRVDTNVSLSDFGSSVWGGSDDEGTTYTKHSKTSSQRSKRSVTTTSSGLGSNDSDNPSLRLYETPHESAESSSRSPTRSIANSSRRGRASHSTSWGNKFCSRWVHKNEVDPLESNGTSFEYDDALTSIDSLSFAPSEKANGYCDSEAESEGSAVTRGPKLFSKMVTKRTAVALEDGTSIHSGVKCKACHMSPIIGMRYHCASCVKGADYCADCERTGYAFRAGIGHELSHLIIRLAAPLDTPQAVDALGAILLQTQERLAERVRFSFQTPSSALTRTINTTVYSNKAIKCSFCISPILSGPRFLCANCPLVSPTTLEGFNLCSSCQEHSLQCHDPSHFFIKVNPIPRKTDKRNRIPLGERWEIQEITKGGPLLPNLYAFVEKRNPLQPPNGDYPFGRNTSVRAGDGTINVNDGDVRLTSGSRVGPLEIRTGGGNNSIQFGSWNLRTNSAEATRRAQEIEMTALKESQARYLVPLETLVHPSILCDNCFSVINGIWYRCCHCTTSFDLCEMCESRISHDPSHSFAVFKQPVDLDLFKSCVDHQDAGEGLIGASRPMLAFPLL
ncbi:hypothetical protein CBS101457_006661 [Exobasidium rhododendri]|nr:hypothetical protein CBS101457_006661 [Exobasidium rhododendri]